MTPPLFYPSFRWGHSESVRCYSAVKLFSNYVISVPERHRQTDRRDTVA